MKKTSSKTTATEAQKNLALDQIIPGTQVRAAINSDAKAEYADAMKSGAEFPPVTVFRIGDSYLLVDGFHRLEAAQNIGRKTILANVRTGSKSDALRFALAANSTHGLRLTNADKRRAVELALAEWPTLSDSEIARICAVSHPTVGTIRKAQPVKFTGSTPPARLGADNKLRRLPVRKSPPPPRGKPSPPPPAKSGPKPKPPTDATGIEIPKEILELWGQADNDVQETILYIKSVKARLTTAEKSEDPVWRGTNFNSALAACGQLLADVEAMLPYAVCPSCNGVMNDPNCSCKGKGFVGEFFWKKCVPEEIRNMRGVK